MNTGDFMTEETLAKWCQRLPFDKSILNIQRHMWR